MNKVTINPQIQLTYQIEGKGDPIILLHGLDGNLAGFEDLQHQLASSYKSTYLRFKRSWQVF